MFNFKSSSIGKIPVVAKTTCPYCGYTQITLTDHHGVLVYCDNCHKTYP